jgi:type VI secretion system protein ImpC
MPIEQRKLNRTRPPRVHITYDRELRGEIEQCELPFVIGVIGDYSGSAERRPFGERTFKTINFDNFNEVMAVLSPSTSIGISDPGAVGGEIEIVLTFQSIDDFEPEALISRVPKLDSLRQTGKPEANQELANHLNRILHTPEFQTLESAWRGLWYLVSRTERSSLILIKLLDVTKRELLEDGRLATEFDQGQLFKKVCEEPYGQRLEGLPFGLLVGNFAFGPKPQDVELLGRLAEIAGACHAPFIAGAAPEMFGIETFSQLSAQRDLAKAFLSPTHVQWKAFREYYDARYAGLVLPRILLRCPYGVRPWAPGEFEYAEDIQSPEHLLWGNAAFAFAGCVANAFSRYGWCGAISGAEGGGLVEGLPTWVWQGDPDGLLRSVVDVTITDRREKELSDLGFLPLVQFKHADMAVFFSSSSCSHPRKYDSDAANAVARSMGQFGPVLTASRFMHYFKVMARDWIGSYHTRGDLERFLNRWASQYVNTDDQASPLICARCPLREARVDVREVEGEPGAYGVVAFLRPYFQLDDVPLVSLRIVGRIRLP